MVLWFLPCFCTASRALCWCAGKKGSQHFSECWLTASALFIYSGAVLELGKRAVGIFCYPILNWSLKAFPEQSKEQSLGFGNSAFNRTYQQGLGNVYQKANCNLLLKSGLCLLQEERDI